MRHSVGVGVLAFALLVPSHVHAVNKCTDENGRVTFQDKACPGDKIEVPPPAPRPQTQTQPQPPSDDVYEGALKRKMIMLKNPQWWVGGTLHKANANEWLAGTLEDQLATAAAYVITLNPTSASDMSKLELQTVFVEVCVTELLKEAQRKGTTATVAMASLLCISKQKK